MAHRICPWWMGYLLLSPLRRLLEKPRTLLEPHVHEGMSVLEPGCGMGYFTLELARMVGDRGRVVAVDLQEKMLAGLRRRARRARLLDRIDARLCGASDLGIQDLTGSMDVAVAIHVVHEVPDQSSFFAAISEALKPGGRLLMVEPSAHVSEAEMATSLATAGGVGLRVAERSTTRRERTALLVRPDPLEASRASE